jgi:hypothetical protein
MEFPPPIHRRAPVTRLSIQPFTEAAGFLDTDELAGWLGVSHMVFAGGFTPVFARAAALELGYAPEAIWGDEWLNFSIGRSRGDCLIYLAEESGLPTRIPVRGRSTSTPGPDWALAKSLRRLGKLAASAVRAVILLRLVDQVEGWLPTSLGSKGDWLDVVST